MSGKQIVQRGNYAANNFPYPQRMAATSLDMQEASEYNQPTNTDDQLQMVTLDAYISKQMCKT